MSNKVKLIYCFYFNISKKALGALYRPKTPSNLKWQGRRLILNDIRPTVGEVNDFVKGILNGYRING